MHLPPGDASSKLACKATGKYRVYWMQLSVGFEGLRGPLSSTLFQLLYIQSSRLTTNHLSAIQHSLGTGERDDSPYMFDSA